MRKFENVLWIVLTAGMLGLCILQPRPSTVVMSLYMIGFTIFIVMMNSMGVKKDKPYKKWRFFVHLLEGGVIMLFLLFIGSFLNLFVPYHALYEYEADMFALKNVTTRDYSQFPDTIPDQATDVVWKVQPSMMQGAGFEGLFFYATQEYIDNEYQRFSENTEIYEYNAESKLFKNGNKTVNFPMFNSIPENTHSGVTVFITYDNGDWNHQSISGVYINKDEKYICYFTQ